MAYATSRYQSTNRFPMILRALLAISLLATSALATAREEVYMEPMEFVRTAFDGEVPEQDMVWVRGELKDLVSEVLHHPPGFLRVRYWENEGRFVFILDEIGKERPITTGLVVDNGVLEQVKVLVFRESRGWEVKFPFFSDQFPGAALNNERTGLDRRIDGITGATLSVRAVTALAGVALLLEEHVRRQAADADQLAEHH